MSTERNSESEAMQSQRVIDFTQSNSTVRIRSIDIKEGTREDKIASSLQGTPTDVDLNRMQDVSQHAPSDSDVAIVIRYPKSPQDRILLKRWGKVQEGGSSEQKNAHTQIQPRKEDSEVDSSPAEDEIDSSVRRALYLRVYGRGYNRRELAAKEGKIDPIRQSFVQRMYDTEVYNSLPGEHKQVLKLRYEQMLSLDEIGRQLGGISAQRIHILEQEALNSLRTGERIVKRAHTKKPRTNQYAI